MIRLYFKTTFTTPLFISIYLTAQFISFPLFSMNESSLENHSSTAIENLVDQQQDETDNATRAPKNKDFLNVRVYQDLDAQQLWVQEDAHIGGNFSVTRNATVGGNLTVQGDTTIEGDLTISGTLIVPDSLITDNITINTITKNGITVAWPAAAGVPGSILTNDGVGNLTFTPAVGGGNVSTALNFTTNNRLVTTDLPSSATNIKEAGVTLDGSNNISGVNSLTAATLNGTLNGNVGTKTTAAVVSATQAVENATNSPTPNTLVLRDGVGSGGFFAGTINATSFVGPVTGSLTGNADTATFATNAGGFTGALSGDVTGNQSTTQVISIGNGAMTSGDVINGATLANQAVSANTINRIVRRDGSGNFAGSTITATQFSGPLTGNVTGNVTGNLTGIATSAVMSDTAQWFSVNLAGNVTGPQLATVVAAVGNKSTVQVVQSVDDTIAANANTNGADTIVKRDGSRHFTINSITINNAPTADSDATNKAYVDSVAQGLSPKTPVVATSIVNTPTATLATPVDGVTLSANDRVLLTQQNYQIDNGIWLAQSSDWTRPTDFALGSTAGQAYVLTTSGLTLAGTGWLCNTPLAIVGTDTVTFVQFTSSGQTTGANVGTGAGEVFRNKTGLTLNFKTLAGATVVPGATGNFVTVSNGANEVSFAVTATSDNTANTLVSRDASGNFTAGTITAALTGAASDNVLKTGDTMTGNLIMASTAGTRHQINWQDSAGTNFVGLRAPTALGGSYTVALPETAPTAGQFLQALDSSSLTWTTAGGLPTATMTYYVAKNGNDANDGSILSPLLTVKEALSRANTEANATNQIAIQIGAGTFDEDNSGGNTLKVLSDGISIVGVSLESTIIRPLTETDNLFTVTVANVEFTNLSLHAKPAATSTASAINFSSDILGHSRFTNIHFNAFQTGFTASSTTGLPVAQLLNCNYTENGTAIALTNIHVLAQSSLFRGSFVSPSNRGIFAQGSLAHIAVLDCTFTNFDTALLTTGDATQHVVASTIQSTFNSIVCTGGSKSEIVGMNFTLNDATSVNITATGLGTKVYLEGCLFNCEDALNNPAGTALQVNNSAVLIANGCTLDEALIGIKCGLPGDTATTKVQAIDVTFIDTDTCVQQEGSSTLQLTGCSLDITKMLINDPTNIDFAGYNTADNGAHLALGQADDISNTMYQILNSTNSGNLPYLSYEPNYYGAKGTVYINPQGTATFNGTQALGNDVYSYVITSSRDKEATLKLISDTANIGTSDNVRGWAITKRGNQADLVFTFTNNDSSGLALRGPYNIMQLNGDQNQVEFPVATGTSPTFTTAHLVWAGDTALYRSADATIKVDNNLIVNNTLMINSLTPTAGVVHNSAVGVLSSSLIVNADIDAAAAIADTKLATISTAGKVLDSATTATSLNNPNTIVRRDGSGNFTAGMITASLTGMVTGTASFNVLKIGDTMTGTLTLPAGTAASPSLQFSGSTNTGLSAPTANRLSFDVSGSEKMTIDATTVIATTTLISAAACILAKEVCVSGVQIDTPAAGAQTVTVTAGKSVLLVIPSGGNVTSYGITLPASPLDGQLLTIMVGNATQVNGITFPGSTVFNTIDQLRATANMDNNSNGQSITLMYSASQNTWYRFSRG